MKIYPGNVKCYEYDNKNRVAKMNVSGAMNEFTYKYNDKNQIIEITEIDTKFILTYNTDGTLSELRERDGVINKKLVFTYE